MPVGYNVDLFSLLDPIVDLFVLLAANADSLADAEAVRALRVSGPLFCRATKDFERVCDSRTGAFPMGFSVRRLDLCPVSCGVEMVASLFQVSDALVRITESAVDDSLLRSVEPALRVARERLLSRLRQLSSCVIESSSAWVGDHGDWFWSHVNYTGDQSHIQTLSHGSLLLLSVSRWKTSISRASV